MKDDDMYVVHYIVQIYYLQDTTGLTPEPHLNLHVRLPGPVLLEESLPGHVQVFLAEGDLVIFLLLLLPACGAGATGQRLSDGPLSAQLPPHLLRDWRRRRRRRRPGLRRLVDLFGRGGDRVLLQQGREDLSPSSPVRQEVPVLHGHQAGVVVGRRRDDAVATGAGEEVLPGTGEKELGLLAV